MEIISVEMIKEMKVEVSMAAKEVVSADLTLINNALNDLAGENLPGQALDKIAEIEQIKAETNVVLKAKGLLPVTVLKNLPASIKTIGDTYQRPSFWPELPKIEIDPITQKAAENVIYMLAAVYPDKLNMIEFAFGGYPRNFPLKVSWGDGAVDVKQPSSGNIQRFAHNYNFEGIDSAITPRGYKTVMIVAAPVDPIHYIDYLSTAPSTELIPLSSFNHNILHIRAGLRRDDTYAQPYIRTLSQLEILELIGKQDYNCYGFVNQYDRFRIVDVD
jgi:hypothetical protein